MTTIRFATLSLLLAGYAAHSASDILANRYGDCKDKHTLLAALLKSVGITAYPALISSRFRVDKGFPSMDLFDHVITAIPKGDSFVFLDTTPEVAPYGFILAGLRDRQTLVVPNVGAATLIKTPGEPPFRSYENVKIDSSIDTAGTLDARMRIEERGDGEFQLRSAYRNTPQNRWDELTQLLVNRMGFVGKTSEVSVTSPEETAKPLVISFSYHRPDFPDWKNNQISLPTPFFSLPELTDEQKASKNALPMGALQDVTFETTVKLPKDYSSIVPSNVARKTSSAEFTAEYRLEQRKTSAVERSRGVLKGIGGKGLAQYGRHFGGRRKKSGFSVDVGTRRVLGHARMDQIPAGRSQYCREICKSFLGLGAEGRYRRAFGGNLREGRKAGERRAGETQG